ncbi:transposase [Escherichia coli]|nr:transposase [Escherichia coli]
MAAKRERKEGITVATDTGKTVLKKQTPDGLYYAAKYLSYMASATVRPEQEASPQWQHGEATRCDAGLLAGS